MANPAGGSPRGQPPEHVAEMGGQFPSAADLLDMIDSPRALRRNRAGKR